VDIVNPLVSDYLLTHCTPADDLLRELAAETRQVTGDAAGMQVSPDEGRLLTMLARLAGARRAVEVGVFTGYSSICIARGLPDGGHVPGWRSGSSCGSRPRWTRSARCRPSRSSISRSSTPTRATTRTTTRNWSSGCAPAA